MMKKHELISAYNKLSETEQQLIKLFAVNFSPMEKRKILTLAPKYIDKKISQSAYTVFLKKLETAQLLYSENGLYNIDYRLKVELFHQAIQQPNFAKYVIDDQLNNYYYWIYSEHECLRNFLYCVFVTEDNKTTNSINLVISSMGKLFPFLYAMLEEPAYDKVFTYSPEIYLTFLQTISFYLINNLDDGGIFLAFLNRNPELNDDSVSPQIFFLMGHLQKAFSQMGQQETHKTLLFKSLIYLFNEEYDKSVAALDKARVIDEEGKKQPRMDFPFFIEFFYWSNFLFYPEGLNLKKLDTFINKTTKGKNNGFEYLLPLLYFLKKDLVTSRQYLLPMSAQEPSIIEFINLFSVFLLDKKITKGNEVIAHSLCDKLIRKRQWLFLNELYYMMRQSGMKVPETPSESTPLTDTPSPLLSRLAQKENWEVALEGLMNVLGNTPASETGTKDQRSSRICYLLNIDHSMVQPILQTYCEKKGWSAGRNIALKKMKDLMVEGMTEQDRRIAATINLGTSYYRSNEYYFNIEKTFVELCGHPFLFHYSNPDVPIELIKSEPTLYTEETKNGITLKTNIDLKNNKITIIKETQTRYRIIILSSKQRDIIRMIDNGITIPEKGKEKLLATVSQLSRVMTIHSDIVEPSDSINTVEADPLVRVQIIPMGDGLKAEMFVKPLSTEPPYFKPGKGGKVAYGTINNEKYQALRNLDAERANAETLNNAITSEFDADLLHEAAFFNNTYDCLNLLETISNHKDVAIVEWPEGVRLKIKKYASAGNLHLNIKGKNNWFELDGELKVDEETVFSIQQLLSVLQKSESRFVELSKGEFLALTEDLRKQLAELEAFVQPDKKALKVNPFASHALNEIAQQAASFKADKTWKDLQKRIKEAENIEPQVPSTLEAELRPYQEEGFRWLVRLNAWGAGACLADDMGLGKTIQAIAMILHLAPNGPTLVVCPASVILNWQNEIQHFAPTLNPVLLKQSNRSDTFSALSPFDVLIVSYGLLQSEEENITKKDWSMAILDEAHAIKNTQTKSSKAAMNIQATFKLALTGTPIQNHLGELWNLFQFCNPGLLGTLNQFSDRYVKNEQPSQKNHLKKLIAPFILRRTKNKVLNELPPKTEITHAVELSSEEMAFYEALRRHAIATIEAGEGTAGQQHLRALAEITKLRQACCNAILVNKDIKLPSSKLEAFLDIIDELGANKHRALVFSQFVGHLSIVRKALDEKEVSYQYLDGSTSIADREKAVKAFQTGKGEVFLISLKAGGLGLNLTAADYVIHLDPWWNPAIEDQASDRAHRIGQTRPVTIYRLVATNTIEEKIVQLHATKRDIADSLLEGADQSARLSTAEMLNLLKEV